MNVSKNTSLVFQWIGKEREYIKFEVWSFNWNKYRVFKLMIMNVCLSSTVLQSQKYSFSIDFFVARINVNWTSCYFSSINESAHSDVFFCWLTIFIVMTNGWQHSDIQIWLKIDRKYVLQNVILRFIYSIPLY
jgi:hypothetical protein